MKTQMWLWRSSVKHKEAKRSSIRKKVTANVKLCILSYFWSTSCSQVLEYKIGKCSPSYTTAVQQMLCEKVNICKAVWLWKTSENTDGIFCFYAMTLQRISCSISWTTLKEKLCAKNGN